MDTKYSISLPRRPELEHDVDGLTQRDLDFLYRMYDGGLDRYVDRLGQIGFTDMTFALDAGCGFGQWSIALTNTCDWVAAVDISHPRTAVARRIAKQNCVTNIAFLKTDIESLPLDSGLVDGVFSYSVVYYSDFEAVVKEWYRVLKPGGRIYLCTNGLGKYVYDILHNPNALNRFDVRKYGVRSIVNTLLNRTEDLSPLNGGRAMTPGKTRTTLAESGFVDIKFGYEGTLSMQSNRPSTKFYNGRYFGLTKVYEMMARKPDMNP